MKTITFWERVREISLFFQGKDEVHKSLRRLANRLERARITYAVVGGLAVTAHNYRRTTADVDLLLTPEGLAEFRKRFVSKNYRLVEGRSRRFTDRASGVQVDFLVTGMFPGSGRPGSIASPDPAEVGELMGKVRVVNLAKLVELKLAARRYQDFADVVNLIRFQNLDESFLARLHPSLHQDFIECLEEKRREDEYEARNG
jgi:hypothetical protein